MIKYLSDCIADLYIKRNIIAAEHKEVYRSGLELILNDIVTFSLIIIISSLFFKTRYAIEYLVTFCVVRVYCGGYHAAKAYICKLTMILCFLCVVVISEMMVDMSTFMLYLILGISFVVILPLIPVKHPNKVLTTELVIKNRKRGITLYVGFSICAVLIFNVFKSIDAYVIAISLSAVTMLAIIGTLVNGRRCKL